MTESKMRRIAFLMNCALVLLALTGCAAPGYDLAKGEICVAEGMTLRMAQEDLPEIWPDTEPSLAGVEYAGIAFRAEASCQHGELRTLYCTREDGTREELDALLRALNADYGIELVKTYDKGDSLTYTYRRNRNSVLVRWSKYSLDLRIAYLPPFLGYEWV